MNGTQEVPPDTIEVVNLDKFVQILTAWHANQCAAVKHMLTMPEGSTFLIGDPIDEEEVVLIGDALKAFKLGIEMTMMQLGTLPFVAEMDDEPEATPVVPS